MVDTAIPAGLVRPATDIPSTTHRSTARSSTERSGTERSGTERSGTERSGTERSGTARSRESPRSSRRQRIAIIAPSRSPIAEPYAGGLEAHVWTLTTALRERGHDVALFAGPGSDPALAAEVLQLDVGWLSLDARRDVSMQPDLVVGEHHAYLSLMLRLRHAAFDVVHNHSLHYLPLAMSDALPMPLVTTLHTPPTPWLESAARALPGRPRFAAVSANTAAAWSHVVPDIPVVANGVDTRRWSFGPGGGRAVWSGRIAGEKGLHLAIAAARLAGTGLDIAGPVVDREYFARMIRPELDSSIRYLGHLDQRNLSCLVRHADVALVTPEWDEPYGLVVAEALASGTPVAAFARGGIPEIVDDSCARLVRGGDVPGLARAIEQAGSLDRRAARTRAEQRCSLESMVDGYETLLAAAAATR